MSSLQDKVRRRARQRVRRLRAAIIDDSLTEIEPGVFQSEACASAENKEIRNAIIRSYEEEGYKVSYRNVFMGVIFTIDERHSEIVKYNWLQDLWFRIKYFFTGRD